MRVVAGRRAKHPPIRWSDSGHWTTGGLCDDAPPSASLAQGIASRLRAALDHNHTDGLEPSTATDAAEAANLSPTTVTNILNGKTWPDIDTIARLEHALDTDLWGNEHRKRNDENDENIEFGEGNKYGEDGEFFGEDESYPDG